MARIKCDPDRNSLVAKDHKLAFDLFYRRRPRRVL